MVVLVCEREREEGGERGGGEAGVDARPSEYREVGCEAQATTF